MTWRDKALEKLGGQEFDVLVIGGGATGAGIALDAASRGLSVALLERADFSEGTSSRSTKLLHGGVRYLELAVKKLDRSQFNLVRDALHERHTLLRLAPHLARRLPLVTPLYRFWELPYYWVGLKAYDFVSGRRFRIGASRALSRSDTLSLLPGLSDDGLRGSVLYYDGQFDDSRMNLAIARTAAEHGATLLNYARVTGLSRSGDRINGAEFEDVHGGGTHSVRAKAVINATGPFADEIRRLADPEAEDILTASSGTHVVLKGDVLSVDHGMLIPKTDDGRVLFLLPWQGHTLVGTTDNPAHAEPNPDAPEEDVDYLLDYLRRYLDRDFSRDDVLSAWTGFRPLIKPQKDRGGTAQITRDHYVGTDAGGLVTITGGKWTTYRHMASDAVDRALEENDIESPHASNTADLYLKGADGYTEALPVQLAADWELSEDVASHLAHAYGGEARAVLELGRAHDLLGRLHPDHPYLEAEVLFAREHEYALTATDVLERRLRLAFLDRAAAEAARPRVEELLNS
ncbi:MAG TPA: FAD-dependent oxidoreductase [Deinococcales bacterium]|nr:FAD-dependent oxidoreductase [Deinococcales bacterium]